MWFIFSSIPQVNCLLCFTLWSTILNLSISSLTVFSFLICLPRNHCATHWSSSPKFSFRSCKLFPVFTFRFYLVWVDFFKYGIRERSNLIKFCISMLVFTRPFVEKTIFFFSNGLGTLEKSFDPTYEGLFLDSLFYWSLCPCYWAYCYYCSFVTSFEIRDYETFNCSFSILFWQCGTLENAEVPMNFRIV